MSEPEAVSPSAWRMRASAWDARGNHDEAINELARGTKAGDVACTRDLGVRLLLGDRAPLLPREGLNFLGEACDRGLGEAAARAAGILALGVHTAPDWPLALAWLARSANAGWQPARAQLRALCDDDALAALSTEASFTGWNALATAIRLDDWRRAPDAVVRCDEPRIATFPGFLRAAVCELLIGFATGRLAPARVYDVSTRSEVVNAHRTNTIATFDVAEVELVHALVQARMAAACGIGERYMEAPTVLHYSPGQQIRDHYDFIDPASTTDYAGEIARNGQRLVTFIVYLNDDYEGGATDFPRLGVTHKGSRGEGIYFVNAQPDLSPELRMLHAGRPPTRG
ncbi:MAG: 2OG-Fe(II) oxygenase, partial [Proteobacteria bacterium]